MAEKSKAKDTERSGSRLLGKVVIALAILAGFGTIALVLDQRIDTNSNKDEPKQARVYNQACNGTIQPVEFSYRGEVKILNPGLQCKIEYEVSTGTIAGLNPFGKKLFVASSATHNLHCNPCNVDRFQSETATAKILYRLVPIPR